MRTRIAVATCWAAVAAACGTHPHGPCDFNVARPSGRPEFIGPKDVLARVRVAVQRGSPIDIVQVDLNGIDRILAAGGPPGSYGVEVRNVSDRTLSDVAVTMRVLTERDGGSIGSRLNGPLEPGRTSWVRGLGHVPVDAADAGTARINVTVESAVVDSCSHPVETPPAEWVSPISR